MQTRRERVTRAEFDAAVEALWAELQYQDGLPIRTADEAKDVPGFLSLARVYMRKAEDAWATQPATAQPDNTVQVTEALHGLRKIAAIAIRAMIYNGVVRR